MADTATSETTERLPPQNLGAEAAVIGSMLLDNDVIPDVAHLLHAEDFYSPDHRVVFRTALALFDDGKPVDLLLLTDTLQQAGELERVGGAAFLVSLLESVPSAANAEYYARIVREASVRRRLIHATNQVARAAYDASLDTDSLLDLAQGEIFALSQADVSNEATAVSDILHEVFKDIEAMSRDRITGLRTYFRDLDDLTCGLQPSELIIIAGRPSMGKTTLALNIASRIWADGIRPTRRRRCPWPSSPSRWPSR